MKRSPLVDKASVSEVRKRLRDELEGSGADDSLAFDCLVALTEACTNALMHGRNDESVSRRPAVEWEVASSGVTIVVRDYSSHGWDETPYPSVPFDDEMAAPEARVGGLGLKMMDDLMDEVDVARSREGTRVTLKKSLRAGARMSSC